jgi:two-component system, NtrC family, sensor histidine kinase KinB
MLRTRLSAGFLCLLIIVLAMGLYSIDRCSQLGQKLQTMLKEDYQAFYGVQELEKSTAKMTSLLLKGSDTKAAEARVEFVEVSRLFAEQLAEQERTAQNKELKELTQELSKAYKNYLINAWKLLDAEQPSNLPQVTQQLGVNTTQILTITDNILEARKRHMQGQSTRAGEQTNVAVRLLILSMILASVLTLYFTLHAHHWILSPLTALTRSIEQVGEGNLDQHLPTTSTDEIGLLSSSFNKMIGRLKGYHESSTEKLSRLDQTMRKTLTSFPDPIFVLNAESAVIFRNPAADSLAVKLLFAGMARLPEQVQRIVTQVLEGGEDYVATSYKEAIHFPLNDSEVYSLPRVVLLKDDDEVSFGVAVILEDITRLRLLDEVKSNLISTVSHELKTPLTGLRMSIYLLQEKSLGALNEDQTELVTTARDSVDRMLNMLNDFLSLTRLEEGMPNLNLQPIAPHDLILQAVEDASPLSMESGVQVRLLSPPRLPAVLVDSQRIRYVFNNLLGNAMKYSPRGGLVSILAEKTDDNKVIFTIKDQGPGIALEYQARLFEKFYRVPHSLQPGTGLGLSIAREIILAHGGEIGVRSRLGEGSEFYVSLPMMPISPGSA